MKLSSKRPFIFSLFFWVFVGVFVLLQFFTLHTSPLPWFDETFFASIAWHWANTGKLVPQVAIFTEVKLYGPIYFWLTGISFQLFGFSIASFRLVNLMAGGVVVWLSSGLFGQLYQHYLPQQPNWRLWQKGWWLLLLTDPLYYLVMHEGRMDLLALSFALGSIYLLMPGLLRAQTLPWYQVAASGLMVALASLTTPRVAFIFVPLTVALVWQWRRQLPLLMLWGGCIIGLYSSWIYVAFGSLTSFVDTYLGQNEAIKDSLVGWFVGGVGYVPRHSYVLIVTAFLASVLLLCKYPRRFWVAPIMVGLGSIGLFYCLVRDYGQYSVFILPFYYLLVFYSLSQLPARRYHLQMYPLVLLAMFNLSYFALKNLQVVASLHQRKPQQATQFVQKHIPKGARVIGEPMYFYAVLQAGSHYQYMDLYGTTADREARHRTQYKYQYLIVTDHLQQRKPAIVKYYLSQGKFRRVARLAIAPSALGREITRWGLLSSVERAGYNCVIYRRIF
ncbi:hypothetical protein [uncultured Microscilla sp.]|uniref:ArnT family glycosyltransferase n=1 Tax=uncultured Microscilla sp. TaxID=432653 RepID=UPI00262C3DC8|nr:hypothetical protein [uncultured Microscilla sp.]